MSRPFLPGSWLNEIAGSTERWPAWRVLVFNPRALGSINTLVAGQFKVAPIDVTAYVESIRYQENVGFENSNNPSTTMATIRFRRNRLGLQELRPGWLQDGVILRIYSGDLRVRVEDWICIFTGTFRGSPSNDRGTTSQLSEYMEATAHGREERFLNLSVPATPQFGQDTDLGEIALYIATQVMGLGQDEVLMGAQGFKSQHLSNQVVDTNCLDALYQILFTVGKKPKFDSLGRLCAVEVDLDKPAVRIYSAGDVTIESVVAQPNQAETNNAVLLHGMSSTLEKAPGGAQLLETLDAVTGFFESEYKKFLWFSDDHSQRAQNTKVVTKKKIWFSDAKWTQIDEFHGKLEIDTHYLADARETIFAIFLATKLLIAAIDYTLQLDAATGIVGAVVTTLFTAEAEVLVAARLAMEIASEVALAFLLWSMQFIGSGTYEIWGEPLEFVDKELQSKALLPDLGPDEIRLAEYRNDFLSTMEELDAVAREQLRRELVKGETVQITMMDDPLIEVDDIIELSTGERFYVLTVDKTFQRNQKVSMVLTAWKIFDPSTGFIEVVGAAAVSIERGYGLGYGDDYGDEL